MYSVHCAHKMRSKLCFKLFFQTNVLRVEDIGASSIYMLATNVFQHYPAMCYAGRCIITLVTMGALDRIYWRAITSGAQPAIQVYLRAAIPPLQPPV